MDRRAFIRSLAGGLLAAPLAAEGQPATKRARVGMLGVQPLDPVNDKMFKQGLGELGYTEGQ